MNKFKVDLVHYCLLLYCTDLYCTYTHTRAENKMEKKVAEKIFVGWFGKQWLLICWASCASTVQSQCPLFNPTGAVTSLCSAVSDYNCGGRAAVYAHDCCCALALKRHTVHIGVCTKITADYGWFLHFNFLVENFLNQVNN